MAVFRTVEISREDYTRDGLHFVTVHSEALDGRGDICFFIPENPPDKIPLVILLHGVYGSHWAWPFLGGAHLTAQKLIANEEIPPCILAMPSDGLMSDGSAYVKHPGRDIEKWIIDEVPAAAQLVCSAAREDSPLFISGQSMGGYGALRLGAKFASRLYGISAHSSVITMKRIAGCLREPLPEWLNPGAPEYSLLHWLIANNQQLPLLRFDCGHDDPHLEDNRELHKELRGLGIKHSYEEFPGGHNWNYWQAHLADSLRFFFHKDRTKFIFF